MSTRARSIDALTRESQIIRDRAYRETGDARRAELIGALWLAQYHPKPLPGALTERVRRLREQASTSQADTERAQHAQLLGRAVVRQQTRLEHREYRQPWLDADGWRRESYRSGAVAYARQRWGQPRWSWPAAWREYVDALARANRPGDGPEAGERLTTAGVAAQARHGRAQVGRWGREYLGVDGGRWDEVTASQAVQMAELVRAGDSAPVAAGKVVRAELASPTP